MTTPVSIYDVDDAIPGKVDEIERAISHFDEPIDKYIKHRIRVGFGNVPWIPGSDPKARAAGFTFAKKHYRLRHMPNAMRPDGATPDRKARRDPRQPLVNYLIPHESFHTLKLRMDQIIDFLNEMVPLPAFDPADAESVMRAWQDGNYLKRGNECGADSFVAFLSDVDRLNGGTYYDRMIPDDRLFRVGEIILKPAPPVPVEPPEPPVDPEPEPIPPDPPDHGQVIEVPAGTSIVVKAI